MSSTDVELASAYDACSRLARAHYENFPVASWLLPRPMRPHVAAVYAFARIADDFADEGVAAPDERLQRLDAWGACLHDSLAGGWRAWPRPREPAPSACAVAAVDQRALFLALSNTIKTCRLPVALFDDLLSAFRQDVHTRRYENWDQLLDYCRRSANPVGRLVLRIAGHRDAALDRSSDCLCTALQLTNFWQDFARDYGAGRIYLPAEDCAAAGASEADLQAGRLTPAWRAALGRACRRTRELFACGRGVCDGVEGRLALELRLTWHGGLRILERIEQSGYDVFAARPVLGPRDGMVSLWRTLAWRRR